MRANFVGSSLVSAMTQTPASGPFGLVTTPPISSASMGTGVAVRCCAPAHASDETISAIDAEIPARVLDGMARLSNYSSHAAHGVEPGCMGLRRARQAGGPGGRHRCRGLETSGLLVGSRRDADRSLHQRHGIAPNYLGNKERSSSGQRRVHGCAA